MMTARTALVLCLAASARALRVPAAGPLTTDRAAHVTTRRALLGTAAASAVATATAVRADTQPLLEEPTSGFVTDEAKRAAFEKKQRAYKKAWRRYLSDLEFATGDEEAVGAIKSLAALIRAHGPHPRRHPRSLRSRPHPWPYAPGRSLHVSRRSDRR